MQNLAPSRYKVKYNRKKTPGIYALEVARVKKVYVGRSKNIVSRLCQHRHSLRRGKSHNQDLQDCWNEFESEFEFKIVHFGDEDLEKIEKDISDRYISEGWTMLNYYFAVKPTSLLVREEHKAVLVRIMRLLDKGRLTIQQLEQAIENL